jgi:hypothetical protein
MMQGVSRALPAGAGEFLTVIGVALNRNLFFRSANAPNYASGGFDKPPGLMSFDESMTRSKG